MKNINFYRMLLCCAVFIFTNGGGILAQGLGEIDGTLEIKLNSTTGTPHLRLFEDDSSTGGSTRIELRHKDDAGDYFEIRSFLHASTDQRMGWYFNGSDRVVWNELGNGLGIGTDDPVQKLHIQITGNNGVRVEGNGTGDARYAINNGAGTHYLFDDNSNANALKIESSNAFAINTGGTNERLRITNVGQVAIGTTSPDERLHVQVTGNDGIKIEGNGTGDARLWINNTAGSHFLFDDFSDSNAFKISSSNDFALNTNGSERMRILDTGEVGFNVAPSSAYQVNLLATSKSHTLEVLNNTAGNATSIRGRVTSGTGTRYGMLGWVVGSSTGTAYGVYGVAETTPSNSWALYANGDFWYAGSIKSPSDIRLKQNIQNLPSVLDKVLQLETKTYEYNTSIYPGLNLASGTQIGFIAQDLQSHFPTLVEEETHSIPTEDENGKTTYEEASILGVSNMEMIPILTKAIQEQQVLINQLREEMNQLKSEK